MFKNFHKNKYNKGMTLLELLVVIFIFMVISSITIFNYGKFNSSLSLQNLADDIALSARRAQSFAIGVRGVRGYDNSFNEGYGIHFSTNTVISNPSAGSNKSFILFANINPNDKYDYDNFGICGIPTEANECLEILNITSSDRISDFYVGINGSDEGPITDGMLDVFFKRPNPEPTFCVRITLDQNSSCDYDFNVSYVKIRVTNDQNPGVYKTIMISNNGQISVS